MKRGRLFWRIIKRTHADKLIYGFLTYFFVCALIIMLIEPGINHYGDAVWYSFSVITSIGFGDFVAVTRIGRIATIVLGLYGLLVLAIVPGIITSYYTEVVNLRAEESIEAVLYQLENLEKLSKEELKQLSDKVRKWNK